MRGRDVSRRYLNGGFRRAVTHPIAPLLASAFCAGAMVGLAAGVWIGAEGAGRGVREWQGLIAGLLATAAALVTVGVLGWQAGEPRRQEQRLRKARLQGARLLLNVDLQAITSFCSEVAFTLRELAPIVIGDGHRGAPPLSCPKLPERVVEHLGELAPLLDEKEAKNVLRMVGAYQVLRSRLCDIVDVANTPQMGRAVRVLHEGTLSEPLLPLAELYLRASALFDFARGEDQDAIRPQWGSPGFVLRHILRLYGVVRDQEIELVDDRLAVSFQEVVHPAPTEDAEVAEALATRRGTRWTSTTMPA